MKNKKGFINGYVDIDDIPTLDIASELDRQFYLGIIFGVIITLIILCRFIYPQ